SVPSLTGSIRFSVLPSGSLCSTRLGNLPGWFAEKLSKNGTARSSGFGSGVAGFFCFHSSTSRGCCFCQAATYSEFALSALTQAWTAELCSPAHLATMPISLPSSVLNFAVWNQASTSGPTTWPFFGPPAYLTIGPSVLATRSRSNGLLAPQLL